MSDPQVSTITTETKPAAAVPVSQPAPVATPVAPDARFQDVPLGGQPVRAHTTYDDMQEVNAADRKTCVGIWDRVEEALKNALADCPKTRSVPSMEVRNHMQVWLSTVEHLRSAL